MKPLSALILGTCIVFGLSGHNVAAQDKVMVIGQLQEPPHLDPTSAAESAIDQVLYSNVFEGLTRFGPDGSVNSGLAAHWDVSDDSMAYVFYLRPGVEFHDGSEMTAEDVVFSLNRARAEGSSNAQKDMFAGLHSVTALDALTVRVTLAAPDRNLLSKLALGDAVIVAKESLATLKSKPVGTGAFKFKTWITGDRIDLVSNQSYWGNPARLHKVTFKFISDPETALAALKAGDIDAFPGYPSPDSVTQFVSDPAFQVLYGAPQDKDPDTDQPQTVYLTVAKAKVRGLWPDAPKQSTDMTKVYWDN